LILRLKMTDSNLPGLSRIRETAEATAKDHFLELFSFSMRPQGKSLVLTVVLDKKSGPVMVDDCALVSRDLEQRLDELNVIDTPYLLEVSSPGLDRPLRNADDCLRFKGRLAQFVMLEPVDGQVSLRGRLQETAGDQVELLVEGKKLLRLSFAKVKTARLVVEL
jgi:ribosome maturation factor RimP